MTASTAPTPTHPAGPYDPPPEEARWVAAVTELLPDFAARAAHLDESGALPRENLDALHATGIDAALLPPELGGEGVGFRTFGEILRAVAAACPSTACIWLMHVGAAVGLATLGPPDVGRFYAAELRAGRRFANALSEPSSGNMFLLPLQSAEPVDGGWRLSGAKRFVSGCEIADHFIVNVLVDGVPTFFGVQADETVSFVPIWDTLGLRATRSQLVKFDGRLLPAAQRCRPMSLAEANHISAGLAFLSLGVADAALAALTGYATSRELPATGQPLTHLQWVQFDTADVHVRLEAATLYARHSLWLADTGSPRFLGAAMRSKLLAGEIARDVAALGLRVGGASGFLKTSPLQRHFRDAQAGGLMAYSSEVCRDFIGKDLFGLLPGPPSGGD